MGRVKDLLPEEPYEGANCPHEDCKGTLQLEEVTGCSCHISPPCDACVEAGFECDQCHEVFY